MSAASPGREGAVGSLDRGLAVLQLLGSTERPLDVSDVATALRLGRSSAYRLIHRLEEHGWVRTDKSTAVRLGLSAAIVGARSMEDLDLLREARKHLHDLTTQTQETTFLAIADGTWMVYVLQAVGPQVVRMSCTLGSRRRLHATALGRAYLAALPEHERDAMLADLTAATGTTHSGMAELRADFAVVRTRGYAIDDGETEAGVRCVASAVIGPLRRPVASISVAGPADRIRGAETAIYTAVLATARALSTVAGAP